MNSFNELNGFLQLGVLFTKKNFEEDWKFDGFVVSDWGSQRNDSAWFCKDSKQAAEIAINAGSDGYGI
jgi:beta-glucosidase